jgi:GlcNAc-P-P-Und epimerase
VQRAVLFGGAGFIGTHLAEGLRGRGVDVVVADLVAPTGDGIIRYEPCDVSRRIDLDGSKVDAVYNLAAVHRTPGHPDHEYYDTNVAGALNVTEWCARHDVPVVCFTSSISVYGPTETPKDESSALNPNTAYGRSKLLAEQIHRQWVEAAPDRRLLTVRPAVVFGRGERGNFTRLAAALARRRFVYPGRHDVVKSCGYIGDLVRAIDAGLALGERDLTINYAYPNAYTIRDICRAFSQVAGYPEPRMAPPILVRGAMRALRVTPGHADGMFSPARIAKLTASTYVIPQRLRTMNFRWETDIVSGLRHWRESSPDGLFV